MAPCVGHVCGSHGSHGTHGHMAPCVGHVRGSHGSHGSNGHMAGVGAPSKSSGSEREPPPARRA
eukprot:6813851-Prymnesium_polylepis.1